MTFNGQAKTMTNIDNGDAKKRHEAKKATDAKCKTRKGEMMKPKRQKVQNARRTKAKR